jgi:hypothetical protein
MPKPSGAMGSPYIGIGKAYQEVFDKHNAAQRGAEIVRGDIKPEQIKPVQQTQTISSKFEITELSTIFNSMSALKNFKLIKMDESGIEFALNELKLKISK